MSSNNSNSNQRDNNGNSSTTSKDNTNKSAEASKRYAEASQENINEMANLRDKSLENTKQIMQNSVQTAADQARVVTERFTRSLGFTGQDGERFAEQSKQNLEAVARCGTLLTQAFQDLSRSWFELSQKQVQRNLEGATKLARAESVQEFSAIQSELARESLEQVVQSSRTIAEKSLHAADEAGKVFSSVAKSSSQAR